MSVRQLKKGLTVEDEPLRPELVRAAQLRAGDTIAFLDCLMRIKLVEILEKTHGVHVVFDATEHPVETYYHNTTFVARIASEPVPPAETVVLLREAIAALRGLDAVLNFSDPIRENEAIIPPDPGALNVAMAKAYRVLVGARELERTHAAQT